MNTADEKPLTPREAHLILALLTSLHLSAGVGMVVYATLGSFYGRNPRGMLIEAACVFTSGLLYLVICQGRRP